MTTGWFGIPGKTPGPKDGTVHVVHNGKTLCGWTPGPEFEFQFCATGIHLPMIECARCRTAGEKFLAMIALHNTSGRAYRGRTSIQ